MTKEKEIKSELELSWIIIFMFILLWIQQIHTNIAHDRLDIQYSYAQSIASLAKADANLTIQNAIKLREAGL